MPDDKPFPPQRQSQPGREHAMTPRPTQPSDSPRRKAHVGTGKLDGEAAIVTGADSGIGRAVAVLYAREGADVVCAYLEEDEDAAETKRLVEAEGRRCVLHRGDLGDPVVAGAAVERCLGDFGRLDVVVNNAAEQHYVQDFLEVTPEQWDRVFRTNIHAHFLLTRAAVPHMAATAEKRGGRIVNSTSVNAYKGNAGLIAYSSTKGAIVSFTRSIALALVDRGIRVNAVAPGPVWTPLIPATATPEKVERFGLQVPMARAGQPDEIAPSYVFLAADESSYFTGQVLHPNGGYVVNA